MMAEVTLKPSRPVLTVHVGDDSIEVPLTFTRSEFERVGQAEDKTEATIGFFRSYLGDIIDEIGDDDFAALLGAWGDARKAIGMPDPGEASASPS